MKFNSYLGVAASSWLLVILIIAAELFSPFKDLLKSVFYHHWIGKAVIITLAFLVLGFLARNREAKSDEKTGWYSVAGSLIVILVFFVAEFFAG